jgi:hypothetical protein
MPERDGPVFASDLKPGQVRHERVVECEGALRLGWSAQITASDFEIEPIWNR